MNQWEMGYLKAVSLSVRQINISHFRSHDALRLDLRLADAGAARMVVLTGPNGAGKTNVLEAVSLLSPGRGLRGAELAEMKNRAASPQDLWAVSAEIETHAGARLRIGTGEDREGKRRVIRIDGQAARNQSELASLVSAVWLTPQMDRLFIDGMSARRKFLDRLVTAAVPAHATRLNHYDRNLRERMNLLQNRGDAQWITTLEAQLAADAVAVAAERRAMIESLQQNVAALGTAAPAFPQPRLLAAGWTEEQIATRTAVDVEDELRAKLQANRLTDRDTGRTAHGVHRSDFAVFYDGHDLPAAICSTGEQKALLVSIVLSHARMMQAQYGFVPLILLDEVAAHLDEARRAQLFAHLRALNGQIWLTGTDEGVFSALEGDARMVRLGNPSPPPKLYSVN